MLRKLVTRLLESAAGRWPAHLRDDVAREWAAELYTLDHEPGVAAPVRAWRQLRFATSLAMARPPGADPALVHWLRRATPARGHAGLLLVAPPLAVLAAPLAIAPLQLMPLWNVELTPTAVALFAIQNYLFVFGLAALAGTLLARRMLRRRSGAPVSVTGCAWATLPVISGLLVVDLFARAAGQVWTGGGWYAVAAVACLAVLLPPVAAVAAALARRRSVWAVGFAGVSAIGLTLLTTQVFVLLVPPMPMTSEPGWWFAHLFRESSPFQYSIAGQAGAVHPIVTALAILPMFVLATVVTALAHAVRLARPLRPAAVTPAAAAPDRDAVRVPWVVRSRWWYGVALAAAAYSVIAWAVTLAYLTPNIGVQSSWHSRVRSGGRRMLPEQPGGWPEWSTEEGRLWMHELQLSSIVCAALCMLCAMAYRGRPVLPVLAGFAVLLAANMVVVRENWEDPRLLPWLATGGLAVGAAVWWASAWLGARRPPARPRRLLITVTVLAAFLVPGGFFARFYVRAGVQAPPVVLLIAVGLPAILALVAGLGVVATSRRPPRGRAGWLPAGLATMVAIVGVAFYLPGVPRYLPTGEDRFDIYLILAPFILAVPAAAWAIAAIRGRPWSPWRLLLYALLLPLLLVAGYVVWRPTAMAGQLITSMVLFPMEYGRTYDGIEYMPGGLVIGLAIGYVSASRLDGPGRQAAVAVEPAPDGLIDLGHPRPA